MEDTMPWVRWTKGSLWGAMTGLAILAGCGTGGGPTTSSGETVSTSEASSAGGGGGSISAGGQAGQGNTGAQGGGGGQGGTGAQGGGSGQGGSTTACGDGLLSPPESCDDGNTVAGDGCSDSCITEAGYDCRGAPSVCTCVEGSSCEDGNPCTQDDVCIQGDCTGSIPVACAGPDECHQPGACDPATGICAYPPKANGTVCVSGFCNDGACLTSNLRVHVFDKSGAPIPGAKVKVGALQLAVDATGRVDFQNVPPGRTVAQVTAFAYASAAVVSSVAPGANSDTIARLLPLGEPIPFQVSSGADVVKGDVRVIIPANAVVNAQGQAVTGTVQMTVVPLDPTTDFDAMPGPLEGMAIGMINSVSLVSAFMADVVLWSGANQLKLKPGAKAKLEFRLPDSMQQSYALGDTLPAWSYDQTQGIWVEEGAGVIKDSAAEPGKLAWSTDVDHFTWWNADGVFPNTQNCVHVKVLSADNQAPIKGAKVRIVPDAYDYYYMEEAVTNDSGEAIHSNKFCMGMMQSSTVRVQVTHPEFGRIVKYKVEAAEFSGEFAKVIGNAANHACWHDAPVCHEVIVYLGSMTCLKGYVEDIDTGMGLGGATITARYDTGHGPGSDTQVTAADGTYVIKVPIGAPFTVQAVHHKGNDVLTDEKAFIFPSPLPNYNPLPANVTCADFSDPEEFQSANTVHLAPNCSGLCSTWAFGYGDAGSQYVADVAADNSGNILLTGYFEGSLNNLGTPPLVSMGNDDIFVAKLDPLGSVIWAVRFGGAGNDRATAIAVDSFGNPVIVGHFSGGPVTLGANTFTATGTFDGFVMKLNGVDGSAVGGWSAKIGGLGVQRPQDVLVDRDDPFSPNEIIVLGYFDTQIDCNQCGAACESGCSTIASAGGDDIFVRRYRPAGEVRRTKVFGAASDQRAVAGALNKAGELHVTGHFQGTFAIASPMTSYAGSNDAFVAKLNKSLSGIWNKPFGLGFDQHGTAIAVDTSDGNIGDIWFTGKFGGTIVFESEKSAMGSVPDTDSFVAKLDINGTPVWSDVIGDVYPQGGSDIAINASGHAITTGTLRGNNSFFGGIFPMGASGSEDIYVHKLESTTDNPSSVVTIWTKTLGGAVGSYAPNPKLALVPSPSSGPIIIASTIIGNIEFGEVMYSYAGGTDVLVGKLLDSSQ